MKLRTVTAAIALALWIASVGGCFVRSNVLEQATPDTGSTADATSNGPAGENGRSQAPSDGDNSAATAPSGDASSGNAAANDAGGAGSAGDSGVATRGNGDGAAGNAGDAGNAGGSAGHAGGGDSSGGGSFGFATLSGTFGGTIPRVDQQSFDGGNSWFTFNRSATIALEFDAAGKPLALLVPGFTGIPDLSLAVRDVGDEDSHSGSSVSLSSYTVTVRVVRAVYAATNAEIDLRIIVEGQGGNLTLTGSGTQQIRMTLNADGTLSYNSHTRYDARTSSGAGIMDFAQIIDDQGALSPQ